MDPLLQSVGLNECHILTKAYVRYYIFPFKRQHERNMIHQEKQISIAKNKNKLKGIKKNFTCCSSQTNTTKSSLTENKSYENDAMSKHLNW